MSLIPDPDNPTGPAIDTDTGALAPPVHLIPLDRFADPTAPTMAELAAACEDPATHIGWATGITRRDDGEVTGFGVPLGETPAPDGCDCGCNDDDTAPRVDFHIPNPSGDFHIPNPSGDDDEPPVVSS